MSLVWAIIVFLLKISGTSFSKNLIFQKKSWDQNFSAFQGKFSKQRNVVGRITSPIPGLFWLSSWEAVMHFEQHRKRENFMYKLFIRQEGCIFRPVFGYCCTLQTLGKIVFFFAFNNKAKKSKKKQENWGKIDQILSSSIILLRCGCQYWPDWCLEVKNWFGYRFYKVERYPVFYFAIRQWSKDLKHLIPKLGSPGLQG